MLLGGKSKVTLTEWRIENRRINTWALLLRAVMWSFTPSQRPQLMDGRGAFAPWGQSSLSCNTGSWRGHSSGSRSSSSAGMGSPVFNPGDTLPVTIIPFIRVHSRDLWEVPGSTSSLSCCPWWSPDPEVQSLSVSLGESHCGNNWGKWMKGGYDSFWTHFTGGCDRIRPFKIIFTPFYCAKIYTKLTILTILRTAQWH